MQKLFTSLFTAALLLALSSTSNAMHKCTGNDGKISYQDAPCYEGGKSAEALRINPATNGVSASGHVGVAVLDYSGPVAQQAVRANAAMELLANLSTDCKIKLDVYGGTKQTLETCQKYLRHYLAWWKPTSTALSEMAKSDAVLKDYSTPIDRTLASMKKVSANAEYISLKLKATNS
jgi:Domain of unknown function (DUF4124)